MAMWPEGEKLEERIDSGVLARFGYGAQRSDHVQVFLASEIRIEVGFLGDVAETFAVGGEVFVDVLAIAGDFAVGTFEQAGEHLYGGLERAEELTRKATHPSRETEVQRAGQPGYPINVAATRQALDSEESWY